MYGKVFASMFEGSLYGQWEAIVTFSCMIVLSDREGEVDITPEALSARTSIPLEIIQRGIASLEAPDPQSRTPDEEGRRIVRLSDTRAWGWRIVNHAKYRAIRTAEERREYHRNYWRTKRSPAAASNSTVTQQLNRNSSKSTNSRGRCRSRSKETTSSAAPILETSGNWVAEAQALYAQHIGEITHGEIGRHLKPVVQKYGWDEGDAKLSQADAGSGGRHVKAWFKSYLRARPYQRRDGSIFGDKASDRGPGERNTQQCSPRDFVRTLATWRQRCEPLDDFGNVPGVGNGTSG